MPHDGRSVWGGMIPNPKHPDTTPAYDPYRINGDPGSDYLKRPNRDEDGGGLSMSRKPKPSPMKPSGAMALSLPRVGAMQ